MESLDVDVSGYARALSENGATVEAIWAIGREYGNSIEAEFDFGSLCLERVFSKAIDHATTTAVQLREHCLTKTYAETNHFGDMYNSYWYFLSDEENGVYRTHKSEVARTVNQVEQIASHVITPDEDLKVGK